RADIERETRPAVLAFRLEPFVQLELCRAHVRRVARRIAAYSDERVGLFRACGEHAPRPVVLEGAPHEMHAIGKERRGERVTRKAVIAHTIEPEGQRAGAVDPPAAW